VLDCRRQIGLALSCLLLTACSVAIAPVGGPPPHACVPPGQWALLEPSGPRQEPGDRALAQLARQRVVLLGETHDDAEHHRWQLHTIAGLHALRPRMILAFEMFPRRVQPILDDWIAGRLTDQEFLQRTEWERIWGYDARLYLPIFQLARMQRIPMIALNVERTLVSRVGDEGWAAIPSAAREGIGDPAPASREYLAVLYASYQDHELPNPASAGRDAPPSEEDLQAPAFRRFVEAQLVWDRAMAQGIAAELQKDPSALLVAITGSGHLRQGYGIPHQLRDLDASGVVVALPWDEGGACPDLTPVLADALFGVEKRPEPPAPDRPRLGVAIDRGEAGILVREVTAGSIAEEAGLRAGDTILRLAGVAATDTGTVIAVVRRQAPGTWLPIQVRRGDQTLDLVAKFPPRP